MKPFDLEAAKRGEPIVDTKHKSGEKVRVSFIGVHGDTVVVFDGLTYYARMPRYLVMEPRKRTVYVNFYLDGSCEYFDDNPSAITGTVYARKASLLANRAVPVEIEE